MSINNEVLGLIINSLSSNIVCSNYRCDKQGKYYAKLLYDNSYACYCGQCYDRVKDNENYDLNISPEELIKAVISVACQQGIHNYS